MTAPYIIPFNHQPVNTGVTSSTYTVPSGKYARVCTNSAKLRSLNGGALYLTSTMSGMRVEYTNISHETFYLPMSCSRFTMNFNQNITFYINLSTQSPTGTDYHIVASGASYTSPIGEYSAGFPLSIISGVAVTVQITSISYIIEPTCTELWLKAGDILSFGAGAISFEEYNVIS